MYGGSAGGGKTYGLLLEPLRHIASVPNFGAVFFRRTSPQITNEGGLWDAASEIYPLFNAIPKQGTLEWVFPPHGNAITFRHLQHEQNKLDWQGTEVPLLVFDELTHFTETQFFYMLSRNRSTCGVRPYVRASCNPDPGWVKTLLAPWVDREFKGLPAESGEVRAFIRESGVIRWVPIGTPDSKTITFIRASIYDNQVLLRKDPGYLANLKALLPVERARLLDGDWNVRRDGLVYADFEKCLVDHSPETLEGPEYATRQHVGGIDFGFNHPFAAVSGFLDNDDVLWITACRYASNVTIPVHSEALPRGIRWSADPSRPESIAELRNAGHDVIPCVHLSARGAGGETKNPSEHGIDLVSERIRTGRLKIVRDACLPLIRELGVYHYDEKTGKPVKEDDHACFPAGTLVKTTLGDIPIEQVRAGDCVLTREGWFPVKAAGITGFNKPIRRIRFSDGRSLFATEDHPIWTENNGWVRVDALRYGDIMNSRDYSFVSLESRTCEEQQKQLFFRAVDTAVIRTQSTEQAGSISTALDETHFTERYGNRSTGQFRTDGTSTTKMETRSTTTSQILSACPGSIISLGMRKNGMKSIAKSFARIWTRLESRLLSGTSPKKDEHGIENTENARGRHVSRSLVPAKSAIRTSSLSPGGATIGSARTTASLRSDENRDWTLSPASACDAARSLWLTAIPGNKTVLGRAGLGQKRTQEEKIACARDAVNPLTSPRVQRENSAPIHVLSLTDPLQTATVYNLTVDGPHEYYANGVLVKNCDALRYAITTLDRGKVARPLKTPQEQMAEMQAHEEAIRNQARAEAAERDRLARENMDDERWQW